MTRQNNQSETRVRRRRGSETLELALLLPLLLGLVFGTIEFGYYFFLQHNAQGAAREGARAGIPFGATQADASAKVSAFLTQAGVNPANYTITFDPADVGAAAAGTDITVTVEGSWGTVGIRTLGLISSNKIVRGRAVMRKEG
jgi:Flp pilus assembly protein TadG